MSEQPSRQVLDAAPARVLTFLLAVSRSAVIRAALAARGYAQKHHDAAWSLLSQLGTFPKASGDPQDKVVRAAVVELDAWDEPNFAAIRATLEFPFPDITRELFEQLEPKQGPEAVFSVKTLLDRLDILEGDKRPEAAGVLALLAERTYTQAERKRLRTLVDTAQQFSNAAPITDAQRLQLLTVLHAWHTDWATTAKLVIKRRDHLIALGLASRQKRTKKAAAGAGATGASGATGATGATAATGATGPTGPGK
jgi:hypothetical protein